MKKTLSAIVLAVLALTACNSEKISVTEPAQLPETGGFKVDIKINRDDVADTKAYVKSSFATNDVVFIFFSNVDAPKYLEAKHTGAGTWTFTAMNGLTSADLEGTLVKQMTAIYLPYGSNFTVGKSGSAFDFGPIYFGYILQAEQVAYTISNDVLSGSITLTAPTLQENEKFIHFDVQGFTPGHSYELRQAYVKCSYMNYVNSLGRVFYDEGSYPAGSSLYGYEDGSNLTFSGVLVADAYNTELDYKFAIIDRTDNIIYYRDAGNKTLSASKYIGLGNINSSTWNKMQFVDLGLPSGTLWANRNIGSSIETDYGDYFAWGETTPYYEAGYAQENPQTHWRTGKDAGYAFASYSLNPTGDGNTFTKYTGEDYLDVLESADDAAAAALGGLGYMPTSDNWNELRDNSNCTWSWRTNYNDTGVKGYLVTSKVSGYESRSIFLPAVGYRSGTNLSDLNTTGYYWSSTLAGGSSSNQGKHLYIYSVNDVMSFQSRAFGCAVRPVCVLP